MHALIEAVSSYFQSSNFAAAFLDAALKGAVVLALAGGLCLCWRGASAATRHLIWFLAVVSLPCLPMLSSMLPSWHRPLWSVSTGFGSGNDVSMALELDPARHPGSSARNAETPPAAAADRGLSGGGQRIAAHFQKSRLLFAVIAWFAGIVLVLGSVMVGRFQLSRIFRQGRPLLDPDWTRLLSEVCGRLRLRRPVILVQSVDDIMPMTWGSWRPVVLLPAEENQWSPERRRIVLQHELAHVKRWDCLTQMIARIVCALYWFNPLVWLAARQMCIERERACDDLVLAAGSRASDYSEHLIEIARSFRRMPQVAAIAMARSSQLEKRVQAIVDAKRNRRRLRPITGALFAIIAVGLAAAVAANKPGQGTAAGISSDPLREQQIARLQAFSVAKEKQSQTLAAAAGETMSPEFRRFFDAAIKGDWQTVTNMYESFKTRHPQYNRKPGIAEDIRLRTSYWGPVLEISMAYDHVVRCEPKYTQMAVDDMINSIPAGSIYFGGTDPGRALPTAFCKSHVDADPFFTLTQNALADGTYREYLQRTYGDQKALLQQLAEARRGDGDLQALDAELQKAGQTLVTLSVQRAGLSPTNPDDPEYKAAEKAVDDLQGKVDDRLNGILAGLRAGSGKPAGSNTIYTPTSEDSQKSFSEYVADATERLHNHRLKPGEDIKEESNGPGNPPKIQVSGQIAVMSINGLLTKIIFDKNPDREFYIEESFPLDWMFPYLEPHGLIMKINRRPLAELSDAVVRQDREYWGNRVAGMLGDWLTDETPVKTVAGFAERVYLRKDLEGFKGDPRFVENDYATRSFSKWRGSIGDVYSWRAQHASAEAERKRMAREAEFAYCQAFALCPYSPEAVFHYANLLVSKGQISDAILIAETAANMTGMTDSYGSQIQGLVKQLKQMQNQ